MSTLSPFQRRKLTRRFRTYDRQRRGRISWEDITRVLQEVLEISGWALFK